jgi:hypothetical protein
MRKEAFLSATLLGALFILGACESTTPVRDIRATLLDEKGEPIPGALLYAEAVTDEGALSFVHARSGRAGEVPEIAIRALKIPWKRGARLAIAGFAAGKRPTVLHDPDRSVPSDGVLLTLEPAFRPEDSWNPDLLLLEFPFEMNPALFQTLGDPEHYDLRAAFRTAYAACPPDQALDPRQKSKISAIQSLP